MEQEPHQAETPPEQPRAGGDLLSTSFVGLLATQFLGATNDNIYRWLVIGIGKQYVDDTNVSLVLTLGTICFVLPFLLFAAPAGYLGDRFSKRSVMIGCKVAEIAIMSLGIAGIMLGQMWMLLLVVFLMGAQSTLFGPSKLGSIPEMLETKHISSANGLMGLFTVVATVVGMAIGNILTDVTGEKGQPGWWLSALVLTGVAATGWSTSLLIARLPAANPQRKLPFSLAWLGLDMIGQTFRDLTALAANRAILRVALGIAFFWSLGALAQLNIDQYAFEGGASGQRDVTWLLISLVFGVGLGSVLAGVWSSGRVELGILPLGAGGIVVSTVLLFTVEGALIDPAAAYTGSYAAACLFLFLLGISAGLFDVPLEAYLQWRSPADSRGAILAASNFMTFGGMLVISLIFYLLRAPTADGDPMFSSRSIFLICGIATVPVFFYIVSLIPQASIRFFVWLATRTIYRVRVYDRDNLPEHGGALLIANHVSWADGALVLATCARPVRFLIWGKLIASGWRRKLAEVMGAIPILPSPKAAARGIRAARQALEEGEIVCIFPEGGISRTGHLLGFKPGVMKILEGVSVPVIPIYLDQLWGSIFSFERGRFFWKWPRKLSYPVSIWFGKPLAHVEQVQELRTAVLELGAEAVENRASESRLLPQRFLRQCRRRMFGSKAADSSGADLSGSQLLMRALILRRLLLREVFEPDEKYVGLLLPPSAGAVVANAAVTLTGRITANLNYTVSSETMNYCLQEAGIRHVLTSRKVTDKLDLQIDAQLVYLDEFREKVTPADKAVAAFQTFALPSAVLERQLGLQHVKSDDVLTVIFTSGSTGVPKGVLLTHRNVLSNVEAIDQVIHLRRDDVVMGILPFFHSFGFTVTLWTALGLDVKGAYHYSPLDARQIGKLCEAHRGTVLLATPTFLRSYLKRCTPEQFKSLEVVVVGAEKMPIDLAEEFEQKFGVRPVEGYGTTELSPIVSVNVPPSRSFSDQVDLKEGSVGRPVPGVSAKVVDPESWQDLPAGESGMLLIKGPNVMQGYLNQPEKTAEAIRDGWYVTGDIAIEDSDGFITITGRQSRFSKIGGEMVPHLCVEEELAELCGSEQEQPHLAVTSLPCERKGEQLVVLYTDLGGLSPEDACRKLSEKKLPNLWIPDKENFIQVDQIPVLGSGKLDLRSLKELAEQKTASTS